jgi:hypothetical protein
LCKQAGDGVALGGATRLTADLMSGNIYLFLQSLVYIHMLRGSKFIFIDLSSHCVDFMLTVKSHPQRFTYNYFVVVVVYLCW